MEIENTQHNAMLCVYKFKDDIPFNIHFIPSYSLADVISPFCVYTTIYLVFLEWNGTVQAEQHKDARTKM